jgi:hypothetical protein
MPIGPGLFSTAPKTMPAWGRPLRIIERFIFVMAQKSNTKASNAPASKSARNQPKPAYTLERASLLCPNGKLAAALERNFALEPVDFDGIREATEEMVGNHAKALSTLNERALEIHLQRIVGSFVGSACAAGEFYSNKVSDAKNLTSRLSNDSRDEDREPIYGLESKAQRARQFAAELGMQAYALLATAQGAVDAFAAVIGSDWKPFQQNQPADRDVTRMAAQAELDAFENR